MRRLNPRYMPLLERGTPVLLANPGSHATHGHYLSSTSQRADIGQQIHPPHQTIILDINGHSIDFWVPPHRVFVTDAAVLRIMLLLSQGIDGRATDDQRLVVRASEHDRVWWWLRSARNITPLMISVDIIAAPDWTFDPGAIAWLRLVAQARIALFRILDRILPRH